MRQRDVEQLELEKLIFSACKACGVSSLDRRTFECSAARMIICHELRERGFKLQEIAKVIGRGHPAVVNLLKKYDDYSKNDKRFKQIIWKYKSKY